MIERGERLPVLEKIEEVDSNALAAELLGQMFDFRLLPLFFGETSVLCYY